ncbi:MAG: ferredoxin [Pseudohongiellaceae bacterium]|jgi:ferredoxin
MHRVHFRKENVTVEVPAGKSLLAVCKDAGVDPYPQLKGLLSCHKKGFCGTCAVKISIEEGDAEPLSPPSKRELSYFKRLKLTQLKGDQLADQLRLACQAEVQGDMVVVTNPNMKEGWKRHGHYAGRPTRSWERS